MKEDSRNYKITNSNGESIKSSVVSETHWEKLGNLQSLKDQGFITEEEYQERKSQIIDQLTGTSASNSRTASKPFKKDNGPVIAPRSPPDFSKIQEEEVVKHSFDTITGTWTATSCRVKIDDVPFSRGALRMCYFLKHMEDPENLYVAKIALNPNEDAATYFADIEMQMYSKEFAKEFNTYKPPNPVDFVAAWLLELIARAGKPLCAVEMYIPGSYRKHNNNYGYVNENERNTPQAFSHYTFEASKHKILICDIQGVGDLYTDPQIHTQGDVLIGKGKGNMGARGFEKFLSTHQCNAICKFLKLPAINAKRDDVGTVPAQPVMSFQHVDVVNVEWVALPPSLSERSPLLNKKKEKEKETKREKDSCCIIL